jgi:hypothetical protein
VLEEAVERHIALMHEASAQITGVASKPLAPRQHPALLPACAAVLGAVLVLLGQALFFRPAPVAPVIVPAALSPEQSASLRDAEKLNRVLDKLDRKTRSVIAAEMAKP